MARDSRMRFTANCGDVLKPVGKQASGENPADHIGIGTFQPKDKKNQDSAHRPQFGMNARLSSQIASFSAFRSILKAVFGGTLHRRSVLLAMFRPFAIGPPSKSSL